MADVTVEELAKIVGTEADRLLKQMGDAGLPHKSADEPVSDEDKKTLLAHLKSSHGSTEPEAAPKKITLKRKTQGTLKTSSDRGRKTVNVEVRKKRTYVKRDPAELARLAAEEEAKKAAEEAGEKTGKIELPDEAKKAHQEKLDAEAAERDAEAAERRRLEEEEEARLEAMDPADMDPELLRQRAQLRRKRAEAEQQAEIEAIKERKAAEEQARKARLELESEQAKTAKPATTLGRKKIAPKDEAAEEKTRKKAPSRLKERGTRGKLSSHQLTMKAARGEDETVRVRKQKRGKLKTDQQHGFQTPTEAKVHEVELGEFITVSDLAQKMAVKGAEVVKTLMGLGVMATVNQSIDQDTATLVVEEMGHTVKLVSENQLEDELTELLSGEAGTMETRAPVVSVMGHVDHGKTSLLDYIRKSRVASGEAGGITQHIGAYHVETDHGMISFLDTPGHAAFTAMRARGAKSTDIVILVVAADDGVMPQTEEAIQHARAAEMPIIVAVNKIDKEEADPDRVKNELAAKEVIPEDWGGDVQFVPVSAHTGEGIDQLLEAVLLQSELLELKAAKDIPGRGLVIESSLDKGRGSVATVLVQNGTLRQGDMVIAGMHFGRIRAMIDENGKQIKEAGPSIPVEVLGLNGTPDAGDEFAVVENERQAREVAEHRQDKDRDTRLARQHAAKLENMFANMGSEDKKVLNLVVKTDVRGSLEALLSSLADVGNDEVSVNVVSSGVGAITESDINLALTSNAVVFGFNVRADGPARKLAEAEAIELRYYSVIYNLLDDVKDALTGMLSPEMREEIVGVAEVRDIFKSPKFGLIAGSMVVEGTIYRNKPIRVLRDNVVIFEGELESLRRFKDDVNEVKNGYECGIGVKHYTDVKVGDKIEVFDTQEIARTLDS